MACETELRRAGHTGSRMDHERAQEFCGYHPRMDHFEPFSSPVEALDCNPWGAIVGSLDNPRQFQLRRGIFNQTWPMDFPDGPARALEAQPLLEAEEFFEQNKRAAFLFQLGAADPDQFLFRPPPLGHDARAAPCSAQEWLWNPTLSQWMGRSQHDGSAFDAPLFGFWLIEAARSRQMSSASQAEEGTFEPQGRKNPIRAWASLAWEWNNSPEPRAQMCALALRVAAFPSDQAALSMLEDHLHPALAKQAQNIDPLAWKALLSTARPKDRGIIDALWARLELSAETQCSSWPTAKKNHSL
jgi:hypothetical protein